MERLVAKYEQRYKRAREEVGKWEGHQARITSLFAAAGTILGRLPVLAAERNTGILREVKFLTQDLCAKQVESLEEILQAMQSALLEFEKVSKALEKLWRDGYHLLRAEKPQPSQQQFHQRLGARPSLHDCVGGLESLYIMHRDEYLLKREIVSALSYNTNREEDISRLATLLADQPNLPKDEVQMIFGLVLGED